MSAAFTPGPWEAKRFHVHVEGKGIVCSVSNPWNDETERQANANLIAAAPDLYEALVLATAYLSDLPHESAHKIASAIAKARGEPT